MSEQYHEESSLGKAYDTKLVKRLLPFMKGHYLLFWSCFSALCLQVGVEILKPLFVRSAIDGPITTLAQGSAKGKDLDSSQVEAAWQSLTTISLLFGGFLMAELLLRFLSGYGLMAFGQKVVFNLRSQLYRHLQSLSLRFYDKNPVGRLVTRVTSDIESIGELFSSGLVTIAADVLKIICIFVALAIMNLELAIVVLIFFPLMFVVTAWFRFRARSAFRAMRVRLAALNAFLNEALGGVLVTRIFAQEKQQEQRYRERNDAYFQSTLETVKNFSIFFPAVQFISVLAAATLLWYGSKLVFEHSLAAGTFIGFFLYIEMLFRPIREISERYAILQSAMASTERVIKLIDEKNEVPEPDQPVNITRQASGQGEVEFRNVWFSYNQGKSWALRDINFHVQPGQSLALVGATGSGKTSILSLLYRFYDVQKGEVLINGVDVRQYSKHDLRRSMGLVLQDVFLFAGSVLENLRLGDENIKREQVIAAAQATGAAKFLEKLEGGYDAPVAERGATFSTGEKQLIALTRALAFDPRLLVLDEATANIDSESEALIQESLERLKASRTTISVAHRLSTIQSADQILVLHEGQIVERGSHDALLAEKGRYHRLYMLNFEQNSEE